MAVEWANEVTELKVTFHVNFLFHYLFLLISIWCTHCYFWFTKAGSNLLVGHSFLYFWTLYLPGFFLIFLLFANTDETPYYI